MIAADKLDLVLRDEDFVIYYDGETLKTKGGNEFAHKNARVLSHILLKLTVNAAMPNPGLNSAGIFCFTTDRIAKGRDCISENYNQVYNDDFVIQAKFGEQHRRIIQVEKVLDYLDKNQDVMNLIFWSNSIIIEGFRSLMLQLKKQSDDGQSIDLNKDECRLLIRKKYDDLMPEQKAGVNLLSMYHKNGLVLPLMLVMNIITPSEYANSTLAAQMKRDETKAETFFKKATLEFGLQPLAFDAGKPLEFIAAIHLEALKTTEFLGFFSLQHRKISVISELISRGESEQLEFKSTFRWDIRQNKKNPAIEHAALKTMVAFINSAGGDLLIGVEDDGNIIGIETDGFDNDDKFLLHLWSLIKTSMGQDISPYLKTTLEKFDGKTVCRVQCLPGVEPVFLRQKGFDESFYIRIGPSTGSLEISEALKYINEHFRG